MQYLAWQASPEAKNVEFEACGWCEHDYATEHGTCPSCRKTRTQAAGDAKSRKWLQDLAWEDKLPHLFDRTIEDAIDQYDWEDEDGQTVDVAEQASENFQAWLKEHPGAETCNGQLDPWFLEQLAKYARQRRAKR